MTPDLGIAQPAQATMMRRMKPLLIIVAATVAAASLAGAAHASTWKPGTNYLVSETDVNNSLEKKFDSAYCQGIPRFGHSGEFPYEEFIVFDCMIKLDDELCTDVRVKSVKGSKVGYFKLKYVRDGHCY